MKKENQSRISKPVFLMILPFIIIILGGFSGYISSVLFDIFRENPSLLEFGLSLKVFSQALVMIGFLILGMLVLFGPLIGKYLREN